MKSYRWRVVALLFFATTINYVDRQVLGLLKPVISEDISLGESEYGYIVSAFQAAYAIGMLMAGRFIDKFGTRVSYTIAISIWSLAGCLHAASCNFFHLAAARFMLGIGESANFPAAIKTVTEWFPKKERAFATGLFNSGSNVGAIVAPLIVTYVTVKYGWRMAFIVTGMLGFVWIVAWLLLYRIPSKVKGLSKEEYEYIHQDDKFQQPDNYKEYASMADTVPDNADNSSLSGLWRGSMGKTTLGICLARFICDWPWWFFLFWIPDFLSKTFNLSLVAMQIPIVVIYIVSDFGGIFGGYMSSRMMQAGRSAAFSRFTGLLVCALMVLPVSLIPSISSLWIVIAIISLACFAHQGWAANIYTVVSDNYPKRQVATMTSIAGVSGSIGGIIAASAVGQVLEITHSYYLVFTIAAVAYITAWIVLKALLK